MPDYTNNDAVRIAETREELNEFIKGLEDALAKIKLLRTLENNEAFKLFLDEYTTKAFPFYANELLKDGKAEKKAIKNIRAIGALLSTINKWPIQEFEHAKALNEAKQELTLINQEYAGII